VQAHAKPSGDWRTPFERGASTEDIVAYEYRQLLTSVAYMKGLMQTQSASHERTLI
jgi:hypothetical protein